MSRIASLAILFFSLNSWANQTTIPPLDDIVGELLSQKIQGCFKKSYHDPKIYRPLWCNRNTRNLYRDCFAKDVSGGFVLYLLTVKSLNDIRSNKPKRRVYPLKARGGNRVWTFHTFMTFHRYVFDFDFTPKPRVADVFTYFEEMFGVTEKVNPKKYVVRIIPAMDYLDKYSDQRNNWNYYIDDPDKLYPLNKVVRYLKDQHELGHSLESSLEHLALL